MHAGRKCVCVGGSVGEGVCVGGGVDPQTCVSVGIQMSAVGLKI